MPATIGSKRRNHDQGLKRDKGYYVRTCGVAETKSGSTRPKTHYLGSIDDGPEKALILFNTIRLRWRALQAAGHSVWPQEELDAIERMKAQPISNGQTVPLPAAPVSGAARRAASQTIREVSQQYLGMIQQRVEAGQCSAGHLTGNRTQIATLLSLINPDLPINQLDENQLLGWVLALCARPLCRPSKGRKTTPERMSVVTVKAYKKALKAFLGWCACTRIPGTDKPLWVRPIEFDLVFKNNHPKHTEEEIQDLLENGGAEPPAFTLEELTTLYGCHARDIPSYAKYGQLFFLLALNLAFANEEINSLRLGEIVGLGTNSPRIRRFRGKTQHGSSLGVYAEWPLWPEVADLLAQMIQKGGKADLAIKTPDGYSLIDGRKDYVRFCWGQGYERLNADQLGTGVRRIRGRDRQMSFKYLRKTAASLIRNQLGYGKEIGDAFLSHADEGMISHYTPQHWAKVAEAVGKLHEYLQPMFKAAEANRKNVAA